MNYFLLGFYKAAGLAEVSTVAVFDGTKMLMGKRRDNGKFTNPGGHLDPGEDPLEGAKRELLEEAGIKADKLTHLKSEEVTTPTGKKLMIHAYKCNMPGVKTTMKNDPDQEVERWRWIETKDGLPKEIVDNLHSPKNVLLKALGLQTEHVKTAISKKLLSRASKKARKARDLVSAISHKEGLFPGPLAGKYHAQHRLFARAARGSKPARETSHSLTRGKHFWKLFRDKLTSQKLKPQDVLDLAGVK